MLEVSNWDSWNLMLEPASRYTYAFPLLLENWQFAITDLLRNLPCLNIASEVLGVFVAPHFTPSSGAQKIHKNRSICFLTRCSFLNVSVVLCTSSSVHPASVRHFPLYASNTSRETRAHWHLDYSRSEFVWFMILHERWAVIWSPSLGRSSKSFVISSASGRLVWR
jgi:Fe-S-cluster containining protein